MRRPRVYISGPLTNGHRLPHHEIQLNVARAVNVYRQLTDLGFACHLPHLTMYLEWLHGIFLPYETWMDIDRSLIHGFEAVFQIRGESDGAAEEKEESDLAGIPVFYDTTAIHGHFRARGLLP